MQLFATEAQRIGAFKGEILAHAVSRMVLEAGMTSHTMPTNSGQVAKYRRWLPHGASTASPAYNSMNRPTAVPAEHLLQEGVNPTADTIEKYDVDVQMRKYGCLYAYSEVTYTLYEDDVPEAMRQQCGERMGLVKEMLKWGVIRGAQSKMYTNGTARSGLNKPISLSILRKAVRQLEANRADMINRVLGGSMDEGTMPVEPGYIVYHHTDCEGDVRQISNFLEAARYGDRKKAHERELGNVERFRFIQSPELHPYAGQGKAVGSDSQLSAGSSNNDVYPYVVVARDSWADLRLRGKNALDLTDIKPSQKDKADPLGQKGMLGATFWAAPFVQNDGWMVVIEATVREDSTAT